MARVLFSGMVAGVPGHGGATWAVLQYLLGLRRLGHQVVLVEPVDALSGESCAYFDRVVQQFGLEAALVAGGATHGLSLRSLRDAAATADLLVNVNGMLRDPALIEPSPVRLYLDLDPVFNQLWAAQGIDVGLNGHTHFASVGRDLPDCGVDWHWTPQPVVLAEWPVARRTRWQGPTTVGNWRSYGSIHRSGVRYGQKAHSFRRFFELPRRVDVPVYAALAIHPDERDDLAALEENQWCLLDPVEVAATPNRYRCFVQQSWAELAIAKEGYVVSRSGWFSDRSVCYLAAGRPVLAQETGFSSYLPIGKGLLTFENLDDLVAGVAQVQLDYEHHRSAARELAERTFDSDKVLTELLEAVGLV
jgi:hypothetical protein